MRHRIVSAVMLLAVSVVSTSLFAADDKPPVWRVTEAGKAPADSRLGPARGTRDKFHPWTPPSSKESWERSAQRIRERVLVSNGLWPMPPKAELKPVIHGRIDRGDYTVEKVFFASHPGHYVTGNLYRPKKIEGKIPGVICPHGHWANGRFYEAKPEESVSQLASGAEAHMAGAYSPLQARMIELARLGCTVFHYDMVGNADSTQIGHTAGFRDAEAELRLQNFMGLQTFNSICALDFLASLPEVDPARIGVTGSSGGGTQTFMVCAVDSRPATAFPAVMVSTNMQGGCICENADYLRIGINNVALAAVFAPKPLAMSGADDWTIDIETKGLPELKQIYSLYGQADLVNAKAFPQFGHNYNQVAREMMYDWFNAHLALGKASPVKEEDFWPLTPAEMSVFDAEHPLPADSATSEKLREHMTKVAGEQFAALVPKDKDGVAEYRRVIGTAANVLLDGGLPGPGDIAPSVTGQEQFEDGVVLFKGTTGRSGANESVPWVLLASPGFNGTAVLWLDGQGNGHLFGENGQPKPEVKKLLDAGMGVASVDVLYTGEFVTSADGPTYPEVNQDYGGYTFGYNRPVIANRVRDTLTALAGLVHGDNVSRVHLIGTGDAGVWALLALSIAGDRVEKTVVDVKGFDFHDLKASSEPNFLPGALKYGGLGGLAALAAPGNLTIGGTEGSAAEEIEPLKTVYAAAGGTVTIEAAGLSHEAAAERLLK